ncbi:MAG: GTP 3',8-cyclase MoaA [Verrucomicrobiota bacterium]
MISPEPSSNASTASAPADRRGRHLRDLRISLIDRCNLRCQYCLPAELFGENFRFLPKDQLLSFDEIVRIVDAFLVLGVEKIRLTGGEPLLRPGIVELVERIRALDSKVDLALTTNALKLAPLAGQLKAAGLDRVNVSLDALDYKVAAEMAGRSHDPQRVLDAVASAESAGLGVKLNAVIKRGVNDTEILPLARKCKERGWSLRFIEYMDVGASNGWRREDVVTGAEMREQLSVLGKLTPVPAKVFGEVARRYRYEDDGVEVGFIESISAPFCGSCTRARVSATGDLFTCLFAHRGRPLKPLLDAGEELVPALAKLWSHRDDRYSETRIVHSHAASPQEAPEEMWRLGG